MALLLHYVCLAFSLGKAVRVKKQDTHTNILWAGLFHCSRYSQ